ncbi:MAG: hypothetical protein WEB03_07515 [Nitriliruptor sp.]|uniref:hypothetical protein n=1 Tax=Nitriliruptor sp. TaxID=2448056 RepID=UPI0034A0477E
MQEHPGLELHLLEVTVEAQRAVLRARRPEEVVRALEQVVRKLGGQIVPAHVGGDEVLQLDLSLGVRDARLPWAPPDDPARARIQRVLPGVIEDARRMLNLLWAREDRDDPTLRDELTGALHPTATARLVERSRSDAVLVGFALEGTDAVERVHGASRVEVALRQLARMVRSELDVDERLGRVREPALIVVLPDPTADRPDELVERVATRWGRQREVALGIATATAARASDPVAALDELRDRVLDTSGTRHRTARAADAP